MRMQSHTWLALTQMGLVIAAAHSVGSKSALDVDAATRGADTLAVPADSPRWSLQGQAAVAEYQGRECLRLDGGVAVLDDFEMRDGVLDVDVATTARRGFFGFDFRIADDGANFEEVYLRSHKSGLPDAIQYTPVLNTGRNWQIYSGPGFTNAVEIPKNDWFHLRLEVAGAQARLFVTNMTTPALVIDDLKSGVQKGQIALYVLTGTTYYSNFEVRTTPDVAWERHVPPLLPGTLTKWSLSPSYDALTRVPTRPLTRAEIADTHWQDVEVEAPGFVVINRYRESPHVAVSFASDFSKRLDPQPGMKVVYARTTIQSDRAQLKRLELGYSDEVSVFLNGTILFRGRSAQNFRDPCFLGIMSADDDTIYLPLREGPNELMLAVSELGGGWGFIGCLLDLED